MDIWEGKVGDIATRSLFENNAIAIAFAATIVSVGIFIAVLLDQNRKEAQIAEERQDVSEDVFAIASAIERRFAFHQFVAVALTSAVAIEPDLSQENFETLVSPFFVNDPSILNLALETDWRVSHVYPFEPNKAVLGLDYRENDALRGAIERLRDTKEPTLTGPIDLVQGMEGLIYRSPVEFDTDSGSHFVGSVAVVSTVQSLIDLATEMAPNLNVGLTFAPSGEVASARRYGTIDTAADDPIEKSIEVAGVPITISAIPSNGWGAASETSYLIYGVAAILVATLLALMYWARLLVVSRRKGWQQLSDAIEAIDDGFALYDRDDRLVLCNSKYRSFYSRSAHLMVPGAHFKDIIWGGVVAGQYADAVGREKEWFEERMAAHRNPVGAIEQKLDDRWLKVSEAVLDDGSRVGFRVDISSLKEAQHQAEAANQAKTDFLNVMSHEIRTPLSAIIGFASVLKRSDDMPAVKGLLASLSDTNEDALKKAKSVTSMVEQFAARIDANGQHLLNIINDILYWNDIDGSNRPLSREIIPVQSIVKSTVNQLSGLASEKGLSLEFSGSDAFVEGDQVRLRQLLLNLVGNAIKFTESGSVSLHVDSTECQVQITVKDTGTGIPKEHLEKVFDTFFQVESGLDRSFSGSGLGLAISKDIAEKHGGTISVESEVGQGSVFCVTLPRANVADKAA